VSERTEKGDSRIATRLVWMVFAPCEFAVTILIGVPLYLGWTILIYLDGLRSLFEHAATLFMRRVRMGRVFSSTDEKKAAPPSLSEIAAHRGGERQRYRFWLN
jgi:hypothetical protein